VTPHPSFPGFRRGCHLLSQGEKGKVALMITLHAFTSMFSGGIGETKRIP